MSITSTSTQLTPLHQGNTITLRRTVPTDAAFLFEKAYQNLDFMHRFRLNDTPQSVEEVRKRLERQWQSTPEQSGYLEILIIHKQYGPIGLAALAGYSPLHRRAEYLIGLFDEQHRQAWYGVETTLLIADLAFNRYNLHKLDAYTYAYNDAGQKNLLGGGFVDEGLRREHLYSKAEGRFIDLRAFGMTRNDFRSNQQLISRLSRRLVGYDITQVGEKSVAAICSSKPANLKGYKLLGSAISIALSLGAPVYATNYDVTAANDDGTGNIPNSLSWAIKEANLTTLGPDTITLQTDVTIKGVMKRLIDSDVTLQSDGMVRTISGDNAYRPLFIKSGNVNIQNLNLNNGLAKGGDSRRGGGGAGLGGALFVYSGTVSIDSVIFSNNTAQGGSSNVSGRGNGGGGMYGNANGDGGGGLFASSTGDEGAYGGPIGNPYGGFGGHHDGGKDGFDGNGSDPFHSLGNGGFAGGGSHVENGGFGGGGGKGGNNDIGGSGGFGGGGGGYGNLLFEGASNGGFGGGGGSFFGYANRLIYGGFGGGSGDSEAGGGGAGFGGALFAKSGTVTLNNVTFTDSLAIGGTGADNGEGRGGALFICTANEGEGECNAVVNDCGNNTFINNSADDGENDVFGTLNDNNCSSKVILSDFQVHDDTLSWSTAIELGNAGFNVWRRIPGGWWEQINDTLISTTGESSTYTFIDNSAILGQDYEYRLEIDMSANSAFYYLAGTSPVINLITPADEAVLSPMTIPIFQWDATGYDGFRFQYAYQYTHGYDQYLEMRTFPTDSWNSTMSFTPGAESWVDFVNRLKARIQTSEASIQTPPIGGYWYWLEFVSGLEVDKAVYWRIQGKRDGTEDNYSDVRRFTIE